MKKIYSKIWELAKPYYLKGRPNDVEHIKWMMKDALLVCKEENLDDSLLLPLVILHDVGYSKVPKNNPFNLDIRKAHMKEGKKLAESILKKVDYPKGKIEKISYYVSVHDNWALDDNSVYENDLVLATFTDLDFIWMATKKGFPLMMDYLNKDKKELLDFIQNNEKLTKRPFSTKTTKKLFEKYLKEINNS
jgi:HD superfamily phosphodiesterase